MKGIWSAILAMTIGLGSRVKPAFATLEDDARIVIITDHADAAIIPLLRAELNQLGLQVIEVERRRDEVIPRELTEAARQHHAVAAFRVQVSSNTVEVWIADRITGKVSLREVFTQGSDSRVEARLVVLQAVELLRWSLQEVDAPHPLRGEVSSPPPTLTRLREYPQEDPVAFGVAPLFLLSPGGASIGAGAQLDMTLRWSWVGTRFTYGQLVFPAVLKTAAGRAELTTRWFAIEGVVLGHMSKWKFGPSLGLGLAMISTSMHGISGPTRPVSDDSLFTIAPIVDGKMAYYAGKHVQISLGLSIMTPLRSDAIYFEGQQVGTYGKLFVSTALGIQVGIP